jgi:hypothetical protein
MHPWVVEACVFCRSADRPLTREHVFAHWLVRKVHGGRLLPSGTPIDASPSSRGPTTIARVTAEVCAACNAGWMSSLEVSFRQAVFARPRVGLLWPPDRVTISRWFTKTAVLLAHTYGAGSLTADRSQLVSGMPEDIEVFFARRRRPPQSLDFSLDTVTDRGGTTARSVAIVVDEVVAHVAPRGTLTSRDGTRLWPLRTHALRWETLPVISRPPIG